MAQHEKSGSVSNNAWARVFFNRFLGAAPDWYKLCLIGFLLFNPVVLALFGPFVAGWLLLAEFIFTLAMALQCYPLQPGGLLAIEAVIMGLATPQSVYHETEANFAVILLLMFMVAGIYFLRDLLIYVFTKLLVKTHSKTLLSLLFCGAAAVLSAFLDALTVIAVIITVGGGFYGIYHKVASGHSWDVEHDHDEANDDGVHDSRREDLDNFRSFLRSLMMHAAIGTALGGVSTLVGEPQNLLIGELADWNFIQFFLHVAPVSVPVFVVGMLTCAALEKTKRFGYGQLLPSSVREVLAQQDTANDAARDRDQVLKLWIQGIVAMLLVVGLALHIAEVGLIGLSVVILATAFCGVVEEKRIGHAFEEALPFTALLVTFFAIVAVIHQQHLFKPIIDAVLAQEGRTQLALMYLANGALSAISDNVFVATVYITEVKAALESGLLNRDQFNLLAVAVNTGTNIPSVATPNGQAAFLFLLTSALAPLIRLGYLRMMWMALPYTVTMSVTGFLAVFFWL